MLATTVELLRHFWIHYNSLIITCSVWAVVGFVTLSPILVVESVYRAHKIGDVYHFRKGYHLEREKHKKAAKLYGYSFLGIVLAVSLVISLV